MHCLVIDIDALLSGQMQAPQEPMMMADGGPSMSDNSPMMQDMSPRQRMFSIDATIENLLKHYIPEVEEVRPIPE